VGVQKRKCNRNRALRLEALEQRELLSTAVAHARPAIEVSPLARKLGGEIINGWLVGQGVWTPRAKFQGKNTITASGPATPIGAVTFNGSTAYKAAVQDHAIVGYNLENGVGTLTDSSGDRLNIHFTGVLYENGTSYAFSWTGTVNGGTGQFARATGNFSAWGTYSIATGSFQAPSITLTLTHK